MFAYLITLLQPFFHASANVIDSALTNRSVKSVWSLVCIGSIVNGFFVALIWLFAHPHFPPHNVLPWLVLIGCIEMGYLIPYFTALQSEDTSVVITLFNLGKWLIPFLAYFFIEERLPWHVYLGFFILTASGVGISMHGTQRLRSQRAFWNMLLCSILISIQSVIYKHVFTEVDWATGFILPSLITVPLGVSLLWIPHIRKDVLKHFQAQRKIFGLYALDEILTWSGSAASTFAISQLPVTIVSGIGGLQPFFVLGLALLGKHSFPKLFREETSRKRIHQKIVWFSLMCVGIWFIGPYADR